MKKREIDYEKSLNNILIKFSFLSHKYFETNIDFKF